MIEEKVIKKKMLYVRVNNSPWYQVLSVMPICGAPDIMDGDGILTDDEILNCMKYCDKYGFEITYKIQVNTLYGGFAK